MTAPLWFALIFLIPTLFLFKGRWSWIIPGYNIIPSSEKRKYNEEKLCRVVAFLMLTMTLGFLVTGVAGYFVEIGRAEASLIDTIKMGFLLVLLLHLAFTIWYAKTRCRK